ncbi:MAG: GntR family transcriptional regulator [Burkholderiaceae bacterium]
MATTRTEDVIARLREQVLKGELSPGLHLTEANIAQHLGVSRTPVREALRALADERLLIYSANRGYVVRRFALKDILDAYDVRGNLEAMACRLAAERGIDAQTDAEFDSLFERADQLLSGPSWDDEQHRTWRDLNMAFHYLVLDVADNRQLADVARQMRRLPRIRDPRLEPESAMFQSIYPLERARRSHIEHAEILDAIRQRQGARAEGLMREHVWRNREALRMAQPYLAAEDPDMGRSR